MMFNAIVDSLLFGMNVIDTCSNFRGGRSEKMVGNALEYLFQKHKFNRKELFISSKVGYVR
jgi:aryl-alcohol dehydrogenase-like predicted oxidoreductase